MVRIPLVVLLLLAFCTAGLPLVQPARAAARFTPASADTLDAPGLRVMTFNVRYNTPGDGENAWPYRKAHVAGLIRFHGADLVGVQEALKDMLDELQAGLPEFAWFGVGRADGREAGEYSAVFYRTDRLELLDHGTFWLSETPEVPGSKSWDAAIERVVTWGKFRDRRTDAVFFHFNTHFDHRGEVARRESARLIRARIDRMAGEAPVVVTGDFNTTPADEPYRMLTASRDGGPVLHDALTVSRNKHYGPTSTWNGFTAIEPDRRIDFIFVQGPVHVRHHGILSDTIDGKRFPSDHLPVLAEVVPGS